MGVTETVGGNHRCSPGSRMGTMTFDRNRWCGMVYVDAKAFCGSRRCTPGFLAWKQHCEDHWYPTNFPGMMTHDQC